MTNPTTPLSQEDRDRIRADLDRRVPALDLQDRNHCRTLLDALDAAEAEVERLRESLDQRKALWAGTLRDSQAHLDRAVTAEAEVARLRAAPLPRVRLKFDGGRKALVSEEGRIVAYLDGDPGPVRVAPERALVWDEDTVREAVARVIWRWFVGDSLSGFDKPAYAYDREKCTDAASAALAVVARFLPVKPDRDTLAALVERTMRESWTDDREHADTPHAVADAVLAVLKIVGGGNV